MSLEPRRRRKHIAEVGDPYAEGYDASMRRRGLDENPYPPGSEDYLSWSDGWHQERDDRLM